MKQIVDYKPLSEREPDTQYRDRLVMIRDHGLGARSAHKETSITYMGLPALRYDLRNGIPLITERSFKGIWPSSVGEILAFIHGEHTLQGLRRFNVSDRFWIDTVTKEKCAQFGLDEFDLGEGSYGPAFADTLLPDGRRISQIKWVLAQIKRHPDFRTHWVDPWVPYLTILDENDRRKVVVAPCHGWMHWRVLEGRLHLQMHQRAADMMLGVPSNIIQYAALLLAVANVLGMEPGWYYHSFSDAHLYTNQLPWLDEILGREPRAFPRMDLTDDPPTDLFDYRTDHFMVSEYTPHPIIKGIPLAV